MYKLRVSREQKNTAVDRIDRTRLIGGRTGHLTNNRLAVIQLEWIGNSDSSMDNDAEFYLYQEKKKMRNREDQRNHEFRFYYKHYKGLSAIIAEIIDKSRNPLRSDYAVDLIDKTIDRLGPILLSDELNSYEIINGNSVFKSNVLSEYDQLIQDTSMKVGTQLGERADYVDYR